MNNIIYKGKKTCDELMLENLSGNPVKSKEKPDQLWYYMRISPDRRKEILKSGIANSITSLFEEEYKDSNRIWNYDLFKVRLNESELGKLDKAGDGVWVYEGSICPENIFLERKGDGSLVENESSSEFSTINEADIPFGQCYLNNYINSFRTETGIKDLTLSELHSALDNVGIHTIKESPFYYRHILMQALNTNSIVRKIKDAVLISRAAKSNQTYTPALNNIPAPKKLSKKEQEIRNREEADYRDRVEAEELRYAIEREKQKEMEKASQELIDRDNYSSDIDESFADVFDSSLIDYSKEYEESDKRYETIKNIKEWMKDCTNAIEEKDVIPGKTFSPIYRINDDLTITVYNEASNGIQFTVDILNAISFDDTLKGKYMPKNKRELPDFIKFNEVKECFYWDTTKIPTSIKGFPKIIYGSMKSNAESFEYEHKNDEITKEKDGSYSGWRIIRVTSATNGPIDRKISMSNEDCECVMSMRIHAQEWRDWVDKYYIDAEPEHKTYGKYILKDEYKNIQ